MTASYPPLGPPNIPWPEKGEGFEADPYSPAGTLQRHWGVLVRTRRLGGWRGRIMLFLLAGPMLGGLAVGVVELIWRYVVWPGPGQVCHRLLALGLRRGR